MDRLLALMAQLREQGQDFADNDELTVSRFALHAFPKGATLTRYGGMYGLTGSVQL